MQINLENIGAGAASELFDDELMKVITNILDPNTEARTCREINIKLKIKPDVECRERCDMETIVSSKLAPVKSLTSTVTVGMDKKTGQVDAVEHVTRQRTLFDASIEEQTKAKLFRLQEAQG